MSETHLFVLWAFARSEQGRILDDLRSRFDLLHVAEIAWPADRFAANLSRFYGEKLPPGSHKERHCGTGPFLAIILRDRMPSYEARKTSKGERMVNARTFDAKQTYRDWTGGGHRVHGSDDPREAAHDIVLLFGEGPAAFDRDGAAAWDAQVVPGPSELVAAGGWPDLDAMLGALDQTQPYLILRNYEGLPHSLTLDGHDDLDLLVERGDEAMGLLGGRRVFGEPHRVHLEVQLARGPLRVDVRSVGDGYFDAAWQSAVLARRQQGPAGYALPAAADAFWTLLYHALVHKPRLSEEYGRRLAAMAQPLGIEFPWPAERRLLMDRLKEEMHKQGYVFVEPDDLSVWFAADARPVRRTRGRRQFVQAYRGAKQWLKRLIRR